MDLLNSYLKGDRSHETHFHKRERRDARDSETAGAQHPLVGGGAGAVLSGQLCHVNLCIWEGLQL